MPQVEQSCLVAATQIDAAGSRGTRGGRAELELAGRAAGPRTKAPWGRSPRAPCWQANAPRWRPSSSSSPCGDHVQFACSVSPMGQPNLSETSAVLPCSALASFWAVGRSNSPILPYATLPAAKGQAAQSLVALALTPSAAASGCTRPVHRGGQQSHLDQCHSFSDCDGPRQARSAQA